MGLFAGADSSDRLDSELFGLEGAFEQYTSLSIAAHPLSSQIQFLHIVISSHLRIARKILDDLFFWG